MQRCRICKSEDIFLAVPGVKDIYFNNVSGDFDFWACENCKSLNISPMLTGDELTKAYKTYYTNGRISKLRKLTNFVKLKIFPKIFQYSPWLIKKISTLKGFRLKTGYLKLMSAMKSKVLIVDIGCGSAELGKVFVGSPCKYIGYDVDSNCIDQASKSGIDIRLGGIDRFISETEDNSVDFVYLSHILEHVGDPVAFLQLIAQKIKVGGQIIISTPNPSSKNILKYGQYWRGFEAPRHLHLLGKDWLVDYMQSLFFNETEIDYPSIDLGSISSTKMGSSNVFTNSKLNNYCNSKDDIIDISFIRQG